jgi:hypothetical protein
MRGITLDPRGAVIFDGNQNAASVRTIMRTRSMDNLLHGAMIITSKKATGLVQLWTRVLSRVL